MSSQTVSVVAQEAEGEDGTPQVVIKLSGPDYEFNVRIEIDELSRLEELAGARWDDRGSVQMGRCAESPVFWCSGDDGVTAMVGRDDEVWDFAVTAPASLLTDIKAALVAEGVALPDATEPTVIRKRTPRR